MFALGYFQIESLSKNIFENGSQSEQAEKPVNWSVFQQKYLINDPHVVGIWNLNDATLIIWNWVLFRLFTKIVYQFSRNFYDELIPFYDDVILQRWLLGLKCSLENYLN